MFLIDYLKQNIDVIRKTSDCPLYSQQTVLDALSKAVSINADNVAEYMTSEEKWTAEDIPQVITPFPYLWIEYMHPYMPGNTQFQSMIKRGIRVCNGLLFISGDGKQKVNDVCIISFQAIKDFKNKIYELKQTVVVSYQHDKNGMFIEQYEKNNFIDRTKRLFGVSKETGKSWNMFDIEKVINNVPKEAKKLLDDPVTRKRFDGSLNLEIIIGLLTLSFMNCSNVKLQTVRDGVDLIGDRPIVEHDPVTKIYTLTIEPIKKIIASKGGGTGPLTPRALHICRGHFKDFSHGRGLFGKYKGIYWYPSTVRGNKKYGEVIKDYKVLVPKK